MLLVNSIAKKIGARQKEIAISIGKLSNLEWRLLEPRNWFIYVTYTLQSAQRVEIYL